MNMRSTLCAITEAATPGGRRLGAPSDAFESIREMSTLIVPEGWRAYEMLVRALNLASIPLCGRRLSALSVSKRIAMLERLARSDKTSGLVRVVTTPIKLARAQSLAATPSQPLKVAEAPGRYDSRIVDMRTFESDEDIEVDVVVVGTGAGGAPMAHALASRGHAVLMLEEGAHFTRADFGANPLEMQKKMYRRGGATVAWGNTAILLPLGRTVGGTTTINSGTCFRVPDKVLHGWQLDHGLHEFGRDSLDPYYKRVEKMLQVGHTAPEFLSGSAQAIQRGSEALGWDHGPLSRNAPGCDAQGVCCFGCPTDAKRSTNVSYVPAALGAGAMVYTHARVSQVIIEKGRAVGVVAFARRHNGTRVRIIVRASSVVLACGAIHTPALLLNQGIANSSGQIGKGLSIHPAGHAFASFDDEVRAAGVPQGYAVHEFVDQGIRFEGCALPPVLTAATLGAVGPRWTELVENMSSLATFGFMITDTSRGRVRVGPSGRPSIRYSLNDTDRRKMIQAHGLLARIFLAAGARRVYPAMQIFDELRSTVDVERLEREGPARLHARHIDVSAFHPLGSCRMGVDPSRSVVGSNHETHDIPGLFICDGSTVNGPLGVNPQMTIMAMSERASTFVERRVESGIGSSMRAVPDMRLEFQETMAGTYTCEECDTPRELSFAVCARSTADSRQNGELELRGRLTMDGVAESVPCEGQLRIRPLRGTATLTYDLDFHADDGRLLRLRGAKNVSVRSPLSGMTTLYTDILDGQESIGAGVLRFDIANIPSWLASFRVADRVTPRRPDESTPDGSTPDGSAAGRNAADEVDAA